jgi:hypothetical protein
MVGILATWLHEQLRAAWALVGWALFGTVVLLIDHVIRIAMQKRPGSYHTEAGDYFLTEAGDRFLL